MSAIREILTRLVPACLVAVLCSMDLSFAWSGTSQVAVHGEPVRVSPSWPQGAGDVVNDPMRTEGWSPWFSEWPNDVNHYAYKLKSKKDLNHLIAKFAAIKADALKIRLSPLAEPRGLGFTSLLPEGNGIPVLFSIGDQAVIDVWLKEVEKPFGKMELTTAPKAMAPTLTLFVQNPLVELDELVIPDGIILSATDLPTTLQKENADEKTESDKKAEAPKGIELLNQQPDGVSVSPSERIRSFLDSRAALKVE